MHFRFPTSALALAMLVQAGGAVAATQGEMGATSSGSVAITLSVARRVQIGGLSDVSFTAAAPESDAVSTQSVCVWSNTATRGYSVTASGSGPAAAFVLVGSGGATPYSVAWNPAPGESSGAELQPGAGLGGLSAGASGEQCAAGAAPSASLIVRIAAADLQAAQPEAAYAGTLSLLVSPE